MWLEAFPHLSPNALEVEEKGDNQEHTMEQRTQAKDFPIWSQALKPKLKVSGQSDQSVHHHQLQDQTVRK